MKMKISTKLSIVISLVVIITVSSVSFLANIFIKDQFTSYIVKQQNSTKEEIAAIIALQYDSETNSWNNEFVHTLGMAALYEGYIIKIFDTSNQVIWDAQAHDMAQCEFIMKEISARMEEKYPSLDGKFVTDIIQLSGSEKPIGYVEINHYGPFFMSDSDFEFLDASNRLLLLVSIFSLILAIIIGVLISRRLSRPILKTVDAAKKIADGEYDVRILEQSDTKEINMLTHSINNLAASLEKQNLLRKQLTEDVSHELRTPIAVAQSHLEAMILGVWEPTPERLESCAEEIRRIGAMVGELELLVKVDNNNLSLNFTSINLLNLVKKVAGSFEAILHDKNLNISIKGSDLSIEADNDKIKQVLENLITNAIKYSRENGSIVLNVSETPDFAVVKISDDGVGIPQDEISNIFERFYRADKSRNRKTGGTGLGLAIAKSLIEAHGGTIAVDSQFDLGTTFTVCIPKFKQL
jgi:signal transduction histidine kinase